MTSTAHRNGRTALAVALAIGLLVRVFILVQTEDLGTPIVDEQHYVQLAGSLAAGNGLAWAPGQPTSIRPPLYPAFLSLIWFITGPGNLLAVRVVHVGLGLLATYLVFLIGRAAYDEVVGRYAAAVFWLYPSFVLFNVTILTETLFTLLLLAFLVSFVALVGRPTPGLALATGASLGLGALTRSALWPLPLVLCPALFALLTVHPARRLWLATLLLVGYCAIVGPWAVRNTRLQGTFTVVDTMGGMNLRMGNYEHTPDDRMWDAVSLDGEKSWSHALHVEHPGRAFTEGEKDKWAQRKALEYMAAHPGITARRALIKFADFWGLEREFVAGIRKGMYEMPVWMAALSGVAIVASYVGVAIAGVAGIWVARPDWRVHAVLLLPIAALTGVHMLAFGHSRYHLPLIPILAIYAAAFATRWRDALSTSARGARAGLAASIVALVVVWCRQVIAVDAHRILALFGHAS
jgi:4-amino-4-deoxy-L-arabinose transferase-like glycosyltransferase